MKTATAIIGDVATGSFVSYEPGFLSVPERAAMWTDIERHRDAFEAGSMLVNGREVPTPRLVVAFGDERYRYPDMGASLPWPTTLQNARARLVEAAGHHFNYALVNVYRDGRDFAGWHADKMHLHVPGTSIAILSIGAVRPLRFRAIGSPDCAAEVALGNGSLLWMRGNTQAHYEHSIPADEQMVDVRVSVTFRHILEPESV